MCSSPAAFILLNIGILRFKHLCKSAYAPRSSCCVFTHGSVCSSRAAFNDCWIDLAVMCAVILDNLKFQLAVLDLPCNLNSELYYEYGGLLVIYAWRAFNYLCIYSKL